MATRRKLRPIESRQVRVLLDELRDLLLSAQDGRNAAWRTQQLIHSITVNEAYVAGNPTLFEHEIETGNV
jgi:hypothetical protein